MAMVYASKAAHACLDARTEAREIDKLLCASARKMARGKLWFALEMQETDPDAR